MLPDHFSNLDRYFDLVEHLAQRTFDLANHLALLLLLIRPTLHRVVRRMRKNRRRPRKRSTKRRSSLISSTTAKQTVNPWCAIMPAMPFSPSDLPWWGWLLVSFGGWIVCIISGSFAETSKRSGCLPTLIAL